MLVVSDSSPINFLVRLGCVGVLPVLFGTVLIPPEVEKELSRPSTPDAVRAFIQAKPAWLTVRAPAVVEPIPRLHPGEISAISLACEVRSDLIVLDDLDARKAALHRGLAVIGLLGILERADERGLVNLVELASRFPSDYRIDPALVNAALERHRGREGLKHERGC